MRPRSDKKLFRALGVLLGGAFTIVGGVTIHGALTVQGLDAPDRVLAYGVTTLIAGLAATGFALFESRLDKVFCAPPERRL